MALLPLNVGIGLIAVAITVGIVVTLRVLGKLRLPQLPQRQSPEDSDEKMSDAEAPKEVKLKARIKIRFTRVKKRMNSEGKEVIKRVTLTKGTIPRKSVLIFRKTGLKPLPWSAHFVDHTSLDQFDELSFDENYCEPIDPDTGEPKWSDELELLIVSALHGQMVEVATRFWKYVFTRQHLGFAIIGLIAGASITLGLGTVFHAFGGVDISWQTHAPRGG